VVIVYDHFGRAGYSKTQHAHSAKGTDPILDRQFDIGTAQRIPANVMERAREMTIFAARRTWLYSRPRRRPLDSEFTAAVYICCPGSAGSVLGDLSHRCDEENAA
jgi:hypothetical protein